MELLLPPRALLTLVARLSILSVFVQLTWHIRILRTLVRWFRYDFSKLRLQLITPCALDGSVSDFTVLVLTASNVKHACESAICYVRVLFVTSECYLLRNYLLRHTRLVELSSVCCAMLWRSSLDDDRTLSCVLIGLPQQRFVAHAAAANDGDDVCTAHARWSIFRKYTKYVDV